MAWTANEVAALIDADVRRVNRLADSGLLGSAVRRVKDRRVFDAAAPFAVSAALGLESLSENGRGRLIEAVLAAPDRSSVRVEDHVAIDMAGFRDRVLARQAQLSQACALIASDPAIMNGVPCFVGTRVPAHDIADLLAAGVPRSEILEDYPSLPERAVDLAPIYAKAYPRRGRPRRRGASAPYIGAARVG